MKYLFTITLLLFSFILPSILFADEGMIKFVSFYGQRATSVKDYVAAEDLRGALLAADEINSLGGILGKKLEIIDGVAHTFMEAKEQAEEYAMRTDISAIIGGNTSNIALITAPAFNKSKIPTISPIATDPKVTLVGDYIFRACFTDAFQGKVMAQYAIKDLKAKTAVILTNLSSKYSMNLSSFFKEEFERNGEILLQENYLFEDVNFTETINKIKELQPDVVFVPGHYKESGFILKQAHSQGVKAMFLGGDGWGKGLLALADQEATNGHAFSNHWHMDIKTAENKKFVTSYFNKYGGKLIASSAALSYDATMIMAQAIESAGTTDKEKVRDTLAKIKDYKGITGTFSFDENGDPIEKDAVILQYQEGDIMFVKSIKP